MREDILKLNPEQQKAFNRLKKAYKDCLKSGVLFANRYGHLHAYDSKYICSFGDLVVEASRAVSEVAVTELEGGDYLKIINEWTDDDGEHYYGLTEEGHKNYFNEF